MAEEKVQQVQLLIKSKEHHEMQVITVRLPRALIESVQELVNLGIYSSKSEFIRRALRELVRKEEAVAKSLRKVKF